jgi:hypothetical protein
MSLSRLTLPSVAPELWGRLSPAVTAARSWRIPAAKVCSSGWSSGVHLLEPAGQVLFSGALGHHLGEAGHMLGEAVQLGAVRAHVGE